MSGEAEARTSRGQKHDCSNYAKLLVHPHLWLDFLRLWVVYIARGTMPRLSLRLYVGWVGAGPGDDRRSLEPQERSALGPTEGCAFVAELHNCSPRAVRTPHQPRAERRPRTQGPHDAEERRLRARRTHGTKEMRLRARRTRRANEMWLHARGPQGAKGRKLPVQTPHGAKRMLRVQRPRGANRERGPINP